YTTLFRSFIGLVLQPADLRAARLDLREWRSGRDPALLRRQLERERQAVQPALDRGRGLVSLLQIHHPLLDAVVVALRQLHVTDFLGDLVLQILLRVRPPGL